jgi:hypothetical protein
MSIRCRHRDNNGPPLQLASCCLVRLSQVIGDCIWSVMPFASQLLPNLITSYPSRHSDLFETHVEPELAQFAGNVVDRCSRLQRTNRPWTDVVLRVRGVLRE